MLALFYLAAAFCFGQSLEARRSFYAGQPWRIWIIWGYVFAGLGVLAQGPVMLLALWLPYFFATRSYRLRGPDWIHLAGIVVCLGLGGWWFIYAMNVYPGPAGQFWSQYARGMFGSMESSATPIHKLLARRKGHVAAS